MKMEKNKRKKVKVLVVATLFIFTFSLSTALAQEAIPAGGGNAAGIGGSASYTVGQVFYITASGINGSVAQGVQQPYEISIITGIEQAKDIDLVCSAYPNPTTESLILKVDNYNNEKLSYQLFDINGKLLEHKTVAGSETLISLGNLASAAYFLRLTDDNKEIKVFIIIKTKKV